MNNTNITITSQSNLQIHRYVAIFGIPACFVGLILNTSIAYLLLTDKYFKKSTYRLILASVLSDVLSSTAAFIGYLLIAIGNVSYHLGTILCKIILYITLMSFGISIMNLSLISVHRYFIVARSLSSFYRKYKIQFLIACELFLHVASILTSSPILVYASAHPNSSTLCDISNIIHNLAIWEFMFTLIMYIIPVSIMITIYIKLAAIYRNHVRPGYTTPNRAETEIMQKKRFTKVLMSITFSTVLISWPHFACLIGTAVTRKTIYQISLESNILYALVYIAISITISIFVVNPFILLKFDHNVRQKLISLLQKYLC
ncbi:Somatostatin receptor type 4 [Trichoplax sp. H2]|nr:Somatostatin receptor type 4 [Trichoplax sp. H2]|eukprot:RDD36334.1 Somatostatin receptor type 4 [Trichoplax sp. H2]